MVRFVHFSAAVGRESVAGESTDADIFQFCTGTDWLMLNGYCGFYPHRQSVTAHLV